MTKYASLFGLSLIVLVSCNSLDLNHKEPAEDLARFVDPFIGTAGHGHTFPGACLPYGMVQVSPDNDRGGWDWSSGYHHSSDTISGFSHTHLSGTGIGDLLDIALLPSIAPLTPDTVNKGNAFMKKYMATFSHGNETASPGYYKVKFSESEIVAELTATLRGAMHRYTFPESNQATILLDLFHTYNWDEPVATQIVVTSNKTAIGYRHSKGWAANQKVFFALEFSKPFYDYVLFDDKGNQVIGESKIAGKASRAGFRYSTDEGETILVKIALSTVSTGAARQNLDTELSHWNFDHLRNDARAVWNKELNRIKIASPYDHLKAIFYTALYHTMIAPNLYSDVDGGYFGANGEALIRAGKTNYYTFSLWDTFRGLHPLITILRPDMAREFVMSMYTHFTEYGLLPVWSLWGNETYCMIGYHSIPVITDAILKGLIDKEMEKKLFEAMKVSAYGAVAGKDHKGLDNYIKYGYLPEDIQRNLWFDGQPGYTESASRTLEWAYDDWCIAQVAKHLDAEKDYQEFMQRAGGYKLLFDDSSQFMRPRNADGSWMSPFDPAFTHYTNGFTEGNAWQYTWFVPHEPDTLIRLMGGPELFCQRLDTLFSKNTQLTEGAFSDVSGLIGIYAHGNEPGHHIPYLYNFAGQPWKTQKIVRQILDSLYTDKPDGLCGNEDCGQMSAWYVLSALGFYPVNPASGVFEVGSPIFDEAIIQLGNGRKLTILAKNNSPGNMYVQSLTWNGRECKNTRLHYREFMKGGELVFTMGPKPSRWGIVAP